MDASSPLKSNPSISAAASGGGAATKFLAGLPSRGLFSSATLPSSNPGGMRVYICDHNRTLPPEHQMIKTNQTNILIRSLMLKRSKGDSSSKDAKGTSPSEASRKRPADKAADGRASSKRPVTNAQVGSKEASKSRVPDRDIQNLTVERLRALLKEKGLSLKGRKDELIARLRGAGNQS